MSGDTRKVSEILATMRAQAGERVKLSDIVAELGERAFGVAMLLFSLPNAVGIGVIPGISTLFGVPQIILALQMLVGFERPWLPVWLLEKSIARADFERMIDKGLPILIRVERYLKPRATALTGPFVERLMGLVFLVLAIVVSLPIPLGNQPPGVAMAVVALGLTARDGLFVAVGCALGVVAVAIASLVVLGGAAVIWFAVTNFVLG
jgi:hypothetical protein